MAKTVVGVFDSFTHAGEAVRALDALGIDSADIGIVATDPASQLDRGSAAAGGARLQITGEGEAGDRIAAGDAGAAAAGQGAVTGGLVGGAAGLLAGLAALAIPGIGPLVAAGPIAAALAGAGIGAVAGGLIAGLGQVGVPDTDAELYAEAVRRGGALITVRADDERAFEVAAVLRRHGAIDIAGRASAWRQSGWTGYDPKAEPYDRDEIERERMAHRTEPAPSTRLGASHEHPNLGSGAARPGIDPNTDRPESERVRDAAHADSAHRRSGGGSDRGGPGGSDREER